MATRHWTASKIPGVIAAGLVALLSFAYAWSQRSSPMGVTPAGTFRTTILDVDRFADVGGATGSSGVPVLRLDTQFASVPGGTGFLDFVGQGFGQWNLDINIESTSDQTALELFGSNGSDQNNHVTVPGYLVYGDTSDQSLVNGPTLQSFAMTGSGFGEVNRIEIGGTVPPYPSDLFLLVLRDTATADTTSHSQRSGGIASEVSSTISAGSNDLDNVAIECSATNGTVNNCLEALAGDIIVDTGNLFVTLGSISSGPGGIATTGTITIENGTAAHQLFLAGTGYTYNIYSNDASTIFDVDNNTKSVLTVENADGDYRFQIESFTGNFMLSPNGTSALSAGTLGAGSVDTVGNITSVGATSTTLSFGINSTAFTRSWCFAQPNGGVPQLITVTNAATGPTFSCFAPTTGSAQNCVNFSYWCAGQ